MEASTLLGSGNTKKYDIPVSYLDYGYIEKCDDVRTLEKIYKTLKSGDEGCYPHLENFCEEKLSELNPKSRALRKEIPVSSKSDLDREAREMLDEDLKSWTESMKSVEDHLKTPSGPVLADNDDDDLPPIRSGNVTITADGAKTSQTSAKSTNKRVMPREYREWDKIDVDKELEKVDDTDDKSKQKTIVGNTEVKDLPTHIDTKGLSDSEKLLKANREKDKGNEAFRSNDFKEAITYYSRSISLQPTAASYNNRALAYLKNSEWQKALADCNKALSLEPDNVKALLRRSTAKKSLKQYDQASVDLNKVLAIEPNNKRAKDLLEEIEKTKQKEKEERKTKGRRMKIEDVDDMEEETEQENTSPTPNGPAATEVKADKPKSRKMKIEEVESDDEEEEAEVVKVNSPCNEEANDKPLMNGLDEPVKSAKDQMLDYQTDKSGDSNVLPVNDKVTGVNIEDNSTGKEISHDTGMDITETSNENKDLDNENVVGENDTEESSETTEQCTTTQKVEEESDTQTLTRPVFYTKDYPDNCKAYREEANKLFKNGQYGDAKEKYSKVIAELEKLKDQVVNLALNYSNRAACCLKTGDLPGCVKDCNSSLDLVPQQIKPLLRRATAYEHLERDRKAYVDYRHVLLLDSRTEQAHLGTKRCQAILSQRDGPRWREKLQLLQVSPWDIPEVIGLDGKSVGSVFVPTPPAPTCVPGTSATSTSSATKTVTNEQKTTKDNQQTLPSSPSVKPVKVVEKEEPVMSPQEKFDTLKAKGNEHVKKGLFRDAIQCYSECAEILPDQTVSYTNRALCYIRVNQPEDAEMDCSRALATEKDNVKALFRRAQSRKMLKRYREGIEDLKHLLNVEPTNAAAKKEMEVLKNYWREELQNMKKDLSSKPESKPAASTQESKQSSRTAQSGAGKQRKKMVIEEVESEEEETTARGNQKQPQKSTDKKKDGPHIQEIHSKPVSQTSSNKPGNQSSGAKSATDKPASKPVKGKSETKHKPVNKKSQIRETSSGLPQVPKSVPKLDKATPYEFISTWNALKKSDTVEPYYKLLKQIKPADIKTVISNKLDGNMLNVITKCVAEHYITNGEEDESYLILKNLSTVPRFGTVAMFLSSKDKSGVQAVMERLSSHQSSVYSADDIKKLRKDYGV